MTQKLQFSIHISPEQYERYYQGSAKFVHVQTEQGRSLQFPASALRPYVTHLGVRGRFEIEFNEQHKLTHFRRLS
jgi:hypothetical protein